MENFVVKTKQVKNKGKGLNNRSNYVVDNKRIDHLHTDITEIRSYKTASLNIKQNIENRASYRQKNGIRGGGIQNFATEFSFNLPPGHHLSDSQWKKLANQFIFNTAKQLDLNVNELSSVCGFVVHRENGDKNDHMHFMMGNVVGTQFQKRITQRETTTLAKKVWTKFLKTQLDLDHKTYKPDPENVGKNLPLWQARKKKEEQALLTLEESKKVEAKAQKLLEKIERQLAKFFIAVNENNERQINRQSNRLDKSFREAKDLGEVWEKDQELSKRLRKAKESKQKVRPGPAL